VAEASNFSRAALHLGVAQPIVTRKIRKLEEDLGVNLFIRTNRGCTLTQEGELLYPTITSESGGNCGHKRSANAYSLVS
jgi:DNA-binding transcriptional LysR family regulator